MKYGIILFLTIRMATPAAAQPAGEDLRRELDSVARVASVMVDGDVATRIETDRSRTALLTKHPTDQWFAADNFDVRHEPYIRTKKTLMRLARLVDFPCDVNLWLPVAADPPRVQILIRNLNEMSQFWEWGALHQEMFPQMERVLQTGERVTVSRKPGMLSVLAPVYDSLGDVVGLVEVVAREPEK